MIISWLSNIINDYQTLSKIIKSLSNNYEINKTKHGHVTQTLCYFTNSLHNVPIQFNFQNKLKILKIWKFSTIDVLKIKQVYLAIQQQLSTATSTNIGVCKLKVCLWELFHELDSENTKESTVNFKPKKYTLESGFTLGEHFWSATQSVRNKSSSEISEGFLQYFQFSASEQDFICHRRWIWRLHMTTLAQPKLESSEPQYSQLSNEENRLRIEKVREQ